MAMDSEGSAKRWPKGYRGVNHETIGSDILAVLDAVTLPRETLGDEMTTRLSEVRPLEWYPIGSLLEAMETLDAELGHYGLVKMGKRLWERTHQEQAQGKLESVADLLFTLHSLYKNANRGTDIGGWSVLGLSPGCAKLENTTPHHCAMEEGILTAAIKMIGPTCVVKQTECFRDGAESCIYELTSTERGALWMGKHDALP